MEFGLGSSFMFFKTACYISDVRASKADRLMQRPSQVCTDPETLADQYGSPYDGLAQNRPMTAHKASQTLTHS